MDESHGAGHEHHGPPVTLYLLVFLGLCVFTGLSFVVNAHYGIGSMTGLLIILGVAICKAVLVGAFFMHLKWEWGKLYFVIIPVMILGVMMMIVLMPDIVVDWHHDHHDHDEPAASQPKDHH
jgi:cytochrome c oxidase subunit 4